MQINPIRDISFKKDPNDNNDNNGGGSNKKEKKAKDIDLDVGNVDLGTDHSKKGDIIDYKAMVGITVVATGLLLMYSQPTFAFVFLLLFITQPPAYSNEKIDDSVGINSIPKDPLIFDFNNDGVLETTDINNGIFFDHENDGFAESSAWVGDNDGVLVIDNNNNGEIDNGSELLTAETLASFDTNEDGIIDENDTNFANLKILKGDGTLMTLTEAGITSINLNTTSTEITGYSLSKKQDINLILDTIEQIKSNRNAIIHSDRGALYSRFRYIQKLKDKGYVRSMS